MGLLDGIKEKVFELNMRNDSSGEWWAVGEGGRGGGRGTAPHPETSFRGAAAGSTEIKYVQWFLKSCLNGVIPTERGC